MKEYVGMNITGITITGADDAVDPRHLASLSNKYPFVEWGLLRSAAREGKPRYPTCNWMLEFNKTIGRVAPFGFAVHLCGELARRAMHEHLIENWGAPRIQLNGFSEESGVLLPVEPYRVQWILQCNSTEALNEARILARGLRNIAVLWDRSGGSRITETKWPAPHFGEPFGYAGGIGPDNLELVLTVLRNKKTANRTGAWVDMESGVRTEDQFDLSKVEAVLRIAERFFRV